MIVVLSIAESPDRIARIRAFESGYSLPAQPEDPSLAQYLAPSTSQNRNQRWGIRKPTETQGPTKPKEGPSGCPLILVPNGNDTRRGTYRSDTGRAGGVT